MRKLVPMIALSLLALAGRARAGVIGEGRIELRPPTVGVERLEPLERASRIDLPTLPAERVPHVIRSLESLEHRGAPTGRPDADQVSSPIQLTLPEIGPEGLDLEIRSGSFLFKVGAEVVTGKTSVVMTPRLDCDTRDTYFWVRLQYDLLPTLSVYCESFQAAGSILGADTTDAVQRYVWDGYQVQLGARWQPREWLALEGGPVVYALSARGARGGVGGRVGLEVRF